jgi:hypothetical protein
VAPKKGRKTNYFSPSLLLQFLDPGGTKNQDPGFRDKHLGSATLHWNMHLDAEINDGAF